MKFGLCGKADVWEKAEKLGFDYLEMPLNWLGQLSGAAWQGVAEEKEKRRIPVPCCNLLYPKTMDLFTVDDEAYAAYLKLAFGRMSVLGAALVVFGSGRSRNIPRGMDLSSALKILVSKSRTCADIARGYGVSVAVEPLNRTETNVINTVSEGSYFAALVDRPNFGVMADMFHMTKENEAWDDLDMVRTIMHAHIAVRGTRGFPVAADEDINAFFGHLRAVGYDGRMSIEGKTDDLERDALSSLSLLRSIHG